MCQQVELWEWAVPLTYTAWLPSAASAVQPPSPPDNCQPSGVSFPDSKEGFGRGTGCPQAVPKTFTAAPDSPMKKPAYLMNGRCFMTAFL
ncbi:MAG: hypothetical protein BWY09_01189 [Candidatus Hydrogenedentes bacterium ADurb.Bin179]|nr:MAG: hypothetical protein BWY09_01189 [Candidatus Hydrogenedentes bacterium ADurb.Bin179]